MIRVLVADDHTMVRDGIRLIVEAHADMRVVAEAGDAWELLEQLKVSEIDVVILDISMPGPGFIATMEEIRAVGPGPPVLVVSMHPEKQWAVRAFREGAAGYLTKRHSAEELGEAIRQVHTGGKFVTSSLAEILAAQLAPGSAAAPLESLSRREYQVLGMLGSGTLIKHAASQLGLSPRTVSTYRARILEKLKLRNTADIIRYAVENDLVP